MAGVRDVNNHMASVGFIASSDLHNWHRVYIHTCLRSTMPALTLPSKANTG